jgi:hypothetical protein
MPNLTRYTLTYDERLNRWTLEKDLTHRVVKWVGRERVISSPSLRSGQAPREIGWSCSWAPMLNRQPKRSLAEFTLSAAKGSG